MTAAGPNGAIDWIYLSIDNCLGGTTRAALTAALLTHGHPRPLVPVLAVALPWLPLRDERSLVGWRGARRRPIGRVLPRSFPGSKSADAATRAAASADLFHAISIG
jgi:hypothetical protein